MYLKNVLLSMLLISLSYGCQKDSKKDSKDSKKSKNQNRSTESSKPFKEDLPKDLEALNEEGVENPVPASGTEVVEDLTPPLLDEDKDETLIILNFLEGNWKSDSVDFNESGTVVYSQSMNFLNDEINLKSSLSGVEEDMIFMGLGTGDILDLNGKMSDIKYVNAEESLVSFKLEAQSVSASPAMSAAFHEDTILWCLIQLDFGINEVLMECADKGPLLFFSEDNSIMKRVVE